MSAAAVRRAPALVTQFAVPPSPFGMIERPRLTRQVQAGIQEPVTLVCAPAGSGKTALVAASVERAAWVTLEPTEDEPGRLWDAVLTALELAGAVPRDSALAGLAAPVRESRDAFMPLLVNALAELPEPVVLVLDDVHVLRSRECLTQLSFLLLHTPDTIRLVMTARSDPPLPLHVLRVRGRLTEIRATDLAFTLEEAKALLEAHGLELQDDLVTALHTRTEGWGAGLRLAALSLQGREDPEAFVAEFAGDDRVVGDYLLAEVLDRQPPKLRAFLLRTSLVDRVCGGLADALTGDSSGADTLASLERTNGFVLGVDGHREWFRYHRLFAKLLRTRAQRELHAQLPTLHARAARWYAERGASVDALEHAVLAEDHDLAVDIVAGHWFDLYVRGDAAAVRRLLAKLPAERLERDAELSAALACAALDVGDTVAAELHLAHADQAELPEARRAQYLETMALAELGTARLEGDFEAALRAADVLLAEAAAHIGDNGDGTRQTLVHAMLGETALFAHDLPRAGDELRKAVAGARAHRLDYVAVSALSNLALLDVMQRGPADDQGHGAEAIALAARRGWCQIPQTACAHTALALLAFYDLQPAVAAEHLERARAAAAQLRRRQLDFVIAHLDARMRGAAGEPGEGIRVLDDYEAFHRHHGPPLPFERGTVAAMRARLQIQVGELEAAAETLAPHTEEQSMAVTGAVARLALANGDAPEAVELLERSHDQLAMHAVTSVETLVLLAVSHRENGEPLKAARILEEALESAEANRHRWPFLELGRPMEELLRCQIRAGTAHRAIVGELLDAFADRAPATRHVAPLLEPLSEREQAILRYLPTALSNREIAAELFVTTNTVKTHLRSIYRKLDVARRREAVERARDLRLLSSRR